jgi:hypothetical protein
LSGGTQRLTEEGTLEEVQALQCAQDDILLASNVSIKMPATEMSQSDVSDEGSSIFKETKKDLPISPMKDDAIDMVIAFSCDTYYQEELTPFGEIALKLEPSEDLENFFSNIEGLGPSSPYSSSFRDSEQGYSPLSLCSTPLQPLSPGMDAKEDLNLGQGDWENGDEEM